MSLNLFFQAILNIANTKDANTKIIIGRRLAKNILNIELFGANALISVLSINQSKDKNVSEELTFYIGINASVISEGNFILNDSDTVISWR